MTIKVRQADGHDRLAWDAYVARHSEATFFHSYGWRHISEKGAGHKCVYLLAEQGGDIVGILPLTLRKSMLFGKAIISSMFAVYGGPVADNDDAYNVLDFEAQKIAENAGISVLEYRTVKARHQGHDNWQIEAAKSATFKQAIISDVNERMLAIPRKQRAVLRKALDANLMLEETKNIDLFYALYAASVHRLGTPVFPKKIFKIMMEVFDKNTEILIVRDKGCTPVASLLNFYGRSEILPYYAGSSIKNRSLGAHDFMYWYTMERALERGKHLFDFGRSKIGSGAYQFKKNWGFEPIPLEYEYCLMDGAEMPDLSPANSKYEMMSNMWRKMPLSVANVMGPFIARHLG
jgi:FemAB-related protein (PEP-CTERM system-associated)